MIGNILHLCLLSLYTMIVRILDVIVTFIQQFATTNYVTYLLSCHNWIIKLVRGPVGQTQTGPRTSWPNANWSADQLGLSNANWSADQGRASWILPKKIKSLSLSNY